MPNPLTVGFIGAGGIARRHLGVLDNMPDVRIGAIADLVRGAAEEVAASRGAGVFTNYEEMLDQAKPDAVFVMVPPFAHGPVEEALVRRKIPFFVEKPLAVDLMQAEGIAEAVAKAGLITAVGYQWRYFNTVNAVKDEIAANPPRMALGYWLDATPPVPWWGKQAQSGGQQWEQTTHLFDLARYLCGEVTEVYGRAGYRDRERFPDNDIPSVSLATLQFKNGVLANLASTCILDGFYRVRFDLFCEGVVYECNQDSVWAVRAAGREERRPVGDAVWDQDHAFLQAVRSGDPGAIRSDYAEALRTHRLVSRCNQSAAEDRPLTV